MKIKVLLFVYSQFGNKYVSHMNLFRFDVSQKTKSVRFEVTYKDGKLVSEKDEEETDEDEDDNESTG